MGGEEGGTKDVAGEDIDDLVGDNYAGNESLWRRNKGCLHNGRSRG